MITSLDSDVRDAKPDGTNVLPEYISALNQVCVSPAIMSTSRIGERIMILKSKRTKRNINDLIKLFIMRAFNISNSHEAQHHLGFALVTDGEGRDIHSHFYSDMYSFLSGLSWEREILLNAMDLLLSNEYSADGCQIIIGLMVRASRECAARKRFAFSAIINHVSLNLGKTEVAVEEKGKKKEEIVQKACERLIDACIEFIDDYKEKAVKSTFLEPCLLYCAITYDGVSIDLDVHGVSTFLAYLQTSTGIVTSRLPSWEDEAKGTVDFLSSGMENSEALKILWLPENLGKPFSSLKACHRCSIKHRVPSHQFIWPHRGGDTRYQISSCIDPSPSNLKFRQRLALYLKQFTSYFQAENILPRMFTALTTGLVGFSSESMLNDFNIIYSHLKEIKTIESIVEEEDVRFFVFNMETDSSFNLSNARKIFDFIGVTRPSGHEIKPISPLISTSLETKTTDNSIIIAKSSMRVSAAGDIRGGGTGREFVGNLLEDGLEGWNKWVHPNTMKSWIQVDFIDGPKRLVSFGMQSANDCDQRDPGNFTLTGLSTSGQWKILFSYDKCPFTSRFQLVWFPITNYVNEKFTTLRLTINSTRHRSDCVQLAHLKFRTPAPSAPSLSLDPFSLSVSSSTPTTTNPSTSSSPPLTSFACHSCTFVNSISNLTCEMCDTANPSLVKNTASPLICPICTFINIAGEINECEMCGTALF